MSKYIFLLPDELFLKNNILIKQIRLWMREKVFEWMFSKNRIPTPEWHQMKGKIISRAWSLLLGIFLKFKIYNNIDDSQEIHA